MFQTYDIGSIPFEGDFQRFCAGAKSVDPLIELLHSKKYSYEKTYFEEKVVESLLGKIKAGIDIPNYPQFRDMNEMFLDAFNGVEKTREGCIVVDSISVNQKKLRIPEVRTIETKSKEISEKIDSPLKLKICVTGPYTLSSLFLHKDEKLFTDLGKAVIQIIEDNLFSNRYGRVEIVSIDEPVFGLMDDPSLDYGSTGREELLKTWESIFYTVKSKNTRTCIHLHSTSNELFWNAKSLEIVESHVEDPLYSNEKTKKILEREDKLLKASIAITVFDDLLRRNLVTVLGTSDPTSINEKIADTWTDIRKGRRNATSFLESIETMEARLRKISTQFGFERVPYAGTECGLKSFPTYECAVECLRRVSHAAHSIKL